jgi:glutaredoxin-related protein
MKDLDAASVPYEYRDFSDDIRNLKEFLVLRDREPVFQAVRQEGRIGVPCIVREDGSVSLDWMEWIK